MNSSKALKIALLFTLRESRGHRISFVACRVVAFSEDWSRVRSKVLRLHPWTPRICTTLDFCNSRVYCTGIFTGVWLPFIPSPRPELSKQKARGIGRIVRGHGIFGTTPRMAVSVYFYNTKSKNKRDITLCVSSIGMVGITEFFKVFLFFHHGCRHQK